MNDDEDVVTPLVEGFLNLHELYKAMREAGFTRNEALRVVAYLMRDGDE